MSTILSKLGILTCISPPSPIAAIPAISSLSSSVTLFKNSISEKASALLADLTAVSAKSWYDIPIASAISFNCRLCSGDITNLPLSSSKVTAAAAVSIIASCRPSRSLVAIYISLNGSCKSPTAPPITCICAAKSIAPSGSKNLSANEVTVLISNPSA